MCVCLLKIQYTIYVPFHFSFFHTNLPVLLLLLIVVGKLPSLFEKIKDAVVYYNDNRVFDEEEEIVDIERQGQADLLQQQHQQTQYPGDAEPELDTIVIRSPNHLSLSLSLSSICFCFSAFLFLCFSVSLNHVSMSHTLAHIHTYIQQGDDLLEGEEEKEERAKGKEKDRHESSRGRGGGGGGDYYDEGEAGAMGEEALFSFKEEEEEEEEANHNHHNHHHNDGDGRLMTAATLRERRRGDEEDFDDVVL